MTEQPQEPNPLFEELLWVHGMIGATSKRSSGSPPTSTTGWRRPRSRGASRS